MSRHIVDLTNEARKFVFGWDQPLQSFFLQVHHLDAPEDEQIKVWLGADSDTRIDQVEDLVRAAQKHGLAWISLETQRELITDRNEGR